LQTSQKLEKYEVANRVEGMEKVWRERARRLSRRSDLDRTGQNTLPIVVVGIGKERYGIAIADVAEVFPPLCPTPVPGAPMVFSGVINVHGEIRPVLDLRRVLGIAGRTETMRNGAARRVILLRKHGREMALEIDSVEQIRWIGAGELQVTGKRDPTSPHIKGSTADLLMLLSTEALFSELDAADLQHHEIHEGATY
jgi:purine-binding chemotaxis protein CheW